MLEKIDPKNEIDHEMHRLDTHITETFIQQESIIERFDTLYQS